MLVWRGWWVVGGFIMCSKCGALRAWFNIFFILVLRLYFVCSTKDHMEDSIKIRLPAALKREAEVLAERTMVSLSDIVRMAVNEKIQREALANAEGTSGEAGAVA